MLKNIKVLAIGFIAVIGALVISKECCSKEQPIDIQKLLQQYIEEGTGVGAAVGYIENDNIQYYVYGEKSIDGKELVDQETIFEIGSITKVFTTIALMEMIKEGKINLNDPIQKYLPGVKVPQKNEKQITIWHLATHTSELPRMPNNFNPQNLDNPFADYSVEKLYEFLNSYTLTKDPGQELEYSNLGMGLLGHILSLVEHTSYDELIKTKICIPLSMNNTSQHLTPNMQRHLVYGYSMMEKVSNWDLDALAGAGALRSNVEDMTSFLAANMGMIDTPLYESIKASQIEQCSLSHKQCFGWIKTQKNDTTIIWHNGGTGGYRSFIGFDLKNKKGVVILSNSTDPFPDELGFYILDPINFKPERPEYNKALDNPDYLKKFVGTYRIEPKVKDQDIPVEEFQIVMMKNKLYHSDGLQLLPEKENTFQLKGIPIAYGIHFIVDDKMNIIELELIAPDGVVKAYPKK